MSLICNEALWERLRAAEPKIREWKRWLHEHPELSKKEEKTSEYIVAQIKELGLEYEIVGDYGIIATLNSGKPGKTVLLRADMDALPVAESSDNLHGPKETVSQTVGVSHACGHDAHVSMTMGAMRVLCGLREELCGTVLFVFEQAEETGEEIYTMLAALEKYPIDTCYATHVYAGLDAGTISVQAGPRMAAMTSFAVKVIGSGGHVSRPDLVVNPLMCGANMLVNINNIWTNEVDPTKTVTMGFSMFHCGEKSNIIPDEAVFNGGMRYLDIAEGQKAFAAVKRVCECVAAAHRCRVEFPRIFESPYIVNNDEVCSARAEKGIRSILGDSFVDNCPPWFGTETMALYQDKYPGVFAFLGIRDIENGYGAGHHTTQFDMNNDLLVYGTAACVKYAIDSLI